MTVITREGRHDIGADAPKLRALLRGFKVDLSSVDSKSVLSMSNEDEKARAARKSREWKARQAEIAAAIAMTEERARESRLAVERERLEYYRESGTSHLVFEVAAIAVFLVIAVLIVERYIIEGTVESCFAPPARALHQGNCANTIAASRWWWLLPSEQKELIRAKQIGDR